MKSRINNIERVVEALIEKIDRIEEQVYTMIEAQMEIHALERNRFERKYLEKTQQLLPPTIDCKRLCISDLRFYKV